MSFGASIKGTAWTPNQAAVEKFLPLSSTPHLCVTMANVQASEDGSFFNDLARHPSLPTPGSQNTSTANASGVQDDQADLPKPKRVACAICRKRKLKCDGGRPKCGTCARLGHNCAYDEVRRKSGPKRGYVKELEARLAQVETQLKTKTKEKRPSITDETIPEEQHQSPPIPVQGSPSQYAFPNGGATIDVMGIAAPPLTYFDDISIPRANPDGQGMMPDAPPETAPDLNLDMNMNQPSLFDDGMTWEMVGLGLEEPLPTQEAIDELHEIYFNSVHPTIPILHPYRHRASMDMAPHMRPPVALRYAMWALAANSSQKYQGHKEIFYRRARKYLESDEMKGLGESMVSVANCQSWIMVGMFEFQHMYFPRAWASVGRSVRLAMMMGLNRLDGAGLDVKQVIAPPRDWTEREERRRTFWMLYCTDRYESMGTGWPVAVDERDVSIISLQA
ncbi:MAG: hypothetical protein Q9174_006792 [Haloplaca sp. 1 TL-2023]